MRLCVMLSKPSVSVFEIGFEASWEKISKETKVFKLNEKCIKCRPLPVCKTCAASAYLEIGDCEGVPEYLCRYAEKYSCLLYREREQLERQ